METLLLSDISGGVLFNEPKWPNQRAAVAIVVVVEGGARVVLAASVTKCPNSFYYCMILHLFIYCATLLLLLYVVLKMVAEHSYDQQIRRHFEAKQDPNYRISYFGILFIVYLGAMQYRQKRLSRCRTIPQLCCMRK